ncbi:hypothetical protein Moror_10168 [Moniliophthora roreri MCA 2997]|uniref:CxC2-like cysteine cluster KDZ transposase-associated domain-containing protein n=1 Tax=Moniliophthora roreri (strain MCA 2997) TaxID=1381753 RepID=V2XY93_MONRO|nr:hypothetical protein Moror_10168 [Moniliophthora roreri MCA 2997]
MLLEKWHNDYFRLAFLTNLRVLLQLGHLPGTDCSNKQALQGEFTVMGVSGFQTVNLRFCGCEGAPEHYQQLLEVGWWPTSYKEPRSTATLELMWQFHVINLQGQVPPTDFY